MNKKEKNNGCIKIGCLFAVLIIAMLLIFGSKESEPYCNTSELYKFANSYEDLIETHKASGVIKQVDINDKYYAVTVNTALWDKTTATQRQLIRCATHNIAKKKGLKGGIIDPVKMERLY